MREIKIENVLTNRRLEEILLPKTKTFVFENKLERIEDVVKRIVSVVLTNKLKALEIEGISFKLDISYLDPDTVNQKKAEKQAAEKERWNEVLASITNNINVIKGNVEAGTETNISMDDINLVLEQVNNVMSENIDIDLSPESDRRINDNVGNTIVDVIINIDNSLHEADAACISTLKGVFENTLNRLINDEKLRKQEKVANG